MKLRWKNLAAQMICAALVIGLLLGMSLTVSAKTGAETAFAGGALSKLTGVSVKQDGRLTYNGQAQRAAVTTEATSENGQTVTFSYCDTPKGTYTNTVPAFIDAGEYTVYYKASAPDHEEVKGSFTVTIDRKPVTITAWDAEQVYNSSPLTQPEFTLSGLDAGDGHVFQVKMTEESILTDAGTRENVIATVDGVAVTAGQAAEVGNYLITTVNGLLKVNPKAVTVKAQDKTFVSTGEPRSWSQYDAIGLLNDDWVIAFIQGSITSPEESPVINEILFYEFIAGNPNNYIVTTQNGELTMTNASVEITVKGADETFAYDGTDQFNHDVEVVDGELLEGDTLYAKAIGSVTDVADTVKGNNPVDESCRVMRGEEDVTAYYAISRIAGTLTVTKSEDTRFTITNTPRAIPGLVYTGKPQYLVTRGEVVTGEFVYSIGSYTRDKSAVPTSGWSREVPMATAVPTSGWSRKVPMATAAGTYEVWFKVIGDANHIDTDPVCVTATIASPEVITTELPPRPAPSGNLRPVLKSAGATSLELSWTKMKNVDGYDVFIARCNTKNYRLVTNLSADQDSCTVNGLKKGAAYKMYIRPYVLKIDGSKQYVSKSMVLHSYTNDGNGKETNPKDIKLKAKEMTVSVGGKADISAKLIGVVSGLPVLDHSGALRYESSNEKIAKVSEEGKVTGLAEGTCKIRVTACNGIFRTVTVKVAPKLTGISFPKKEYSLKLGKTLDLAAKLKRIPAGGTANFTWKSSKEDIAAVDRNGLVTALKKGTATITVTTKSGLKAKVKIRVKGKE